MFVYFFLKANALIFALQPEGLLSLLSCPLASRIGPGASGCLLRVRKGLELSLGTEGRPRGALASPPSAPPRKTPVAPEGTRCGPRSCPPPPNPGGNPSKHPVHSARQAPRSPQPLNQDLRSGWGATCGPPRAGSGARLPDRLGGSLPGWAAPPRVRGEGRGAWGWQSRRPRCGPTRPRGGAEPARGRLCDWLHTPLSRSARRGARGARTRGPASRPLPTPGARDKRRAAGAGARALQPASATGGPASPAAHPTPLPARSSPGGTCSRARAGDTAPPPPPPKSPKLRGCRPPGAGGKVRARGARSDPATRGAAERTTVGGLSRAAAASQRCEWSARPTAG